MVGQADGYARRLALHHVIDRIAVAAKPTHQHTVDDVISLMELVTLAAGVEDGANFSVVARAEQKAQALARAIVVAEHVCLAALQPRYRDRQYVGTLKFDTGRPQNRHCRGDSDNRYERSDSEFLWPNPAHCLPDKG